MGASRQSFRKAASLERLIEVFTLLEPIQGCAYHLCFVLLHSIFALAEKNMLKCIYIWKCVWKVAAAGRCVSKLNRKSKDTPLQRECQRRWSWACRLWSFWSVQPATTHRDRLSLRQRSWGILLLSARRVPAAPETAKRRKSRLRSGRWWKEEEDNLNKASKETERWGLEVALSVEPEVTGNWWRIPTNCPQRKWYCTWSLLKCNKWRIKILQDFDLEINCIVLSQSASQWSSCSSRNKDSVRTNVHWPNKSIEAQH